MKFVRVVIIPDGAQETQQIKMPRCIISIIPLAILSMAGLIGFLIVDYLELSNIKKNYQAVLTENEGLKGEARLLYSNLEEVKRSLRRVEDYSKKLSDITNIQVRKMSRKTGIGPLTPAEMERAQDNHHSIEAPYVPLGVNVNKLTFRPVFDRLHEVKAQSNQNAIKLQKLLSNLSQKKSLLSSIPSISPVSGWVASGFGTRISPFTGRKGMHNGVDVASPVGTPIKAPADGVVIFSGAKAGFGNFIMLAHGNGVVSRYGHNAQNMVEPGQKVKKGEQIGTVGMTGRTTGPHLHYEILVNGRHVNPKKFMLDL